MIAKYQLSFFHSLRFFANSDEQKVIEQLVAKDCEGKESYEKATNNKIMKKISKVSTEMVKLDSQEGKNRYLCYKATTYKHKSEIVIIYMEGSLIRGYAALTADVLALLVLLTIVFFM